MSKRKFSGSISGKGYYIALILCIVAIGISGYLYYRNAEEPAPGQQSQQVSGTDDASGQQVAAIATQPGGTTGAEEEAATEPKLSKRVAPVQGQTVTGHAVDALSYNQTTRDWRTHDGIDIAAAAGTAVSAAADGTVYTVYEDDTMGMTVVIRHGDNYTTCYSSLATQVDVKPGDAVTAGQTIGQVGNTALLENAIGDHVHFSVSCNGESVDPVRFLEPAK